MWRCLLCVAVILVLAGCTPPHLSPVVDNAIDAAVDPEPTCAPTARMCDGELMLAAKGPPLPEPEPEPQRDPAPEPVSEHPPAWSVFAESECAITASQTVCMDRDENRNMVCTAGADTLVCAVVMPDATEHAVVCLLSTNVCETDDGRRFRGS